MENISFLKSEIVFSLLPSFAVLFSPSWAASLHTWQSSLSVFISRKRMLSMPRYSRCVTITMLRGTISVGIHSGKQPLGVGVRLHIPYGNLYLPLPLSSVLGSWYFLSLQDVKFPLSLDVFDLCTEKLQQKLMPIRAKFKEIEDKKVEEAAVRQMLD